jgi:hypothetical protein
MPHITQPNPIEYNPFYQRYIDRIKGFPVHDLLTQQIPLLFEVFEDVSEDEIDLPMSPGKWTYNQLVGHLLDTEKIMHFRALMIAREPGVSLPGFDQDRYVAEGNFTGIPALASSIKGIIANRKGILSFLETLRSEQLENVGEVDGHPMSARALIYIICGHMQYHLASFNPSKRREL